MAGRIKREDIDQVRERTRIEEVIGQYVTLKSAGVGSLKGLCPFHDEKTPSFHVRPQAGMFHCFGCGEGGDVFTFLQKIDHVTFSEAVEKLAAKAGVQLHYEGGRGPQPQEVGRRQRLLDAHTRAEEYFSAQLASDEAAIAREFLVGRGFGPQDAQHFGVGYAPQGWHHLIKHLRDHGFTEGEISASGLASEGQRGLYDRFRGRLVWPIRDVTGATVGFGARKLYESDQGPKYLNTPETAIYKKSQVLYGVDLAKKAIAKNRTVVVVEGYTDVMACHIAGVETAVATCGTAFGVDHIRVARRLMSDDSQFSGKVVFTFDGDEAGQKAAMRAFAEDQRFAAQTFAAIVPGGQDPCDLRSESGDAAVRQLIESAVPLYQFALESTVRSFDLNTVEGRAGALRAVAPIVAQIRDSTMRIEYTRRLESIIGVTIDQATSAVQAAAREVVRNPVAAPQLSETPPGFASESAQRQDREQPSAGKSVMRSAHPDIRSERHVLAGSIQYPHLVTAEQWEHLAATRLFTQRVFQEVARAVVAVHAEQSPSHEPAQQWGNWVNRIVEQVPEALKDIVIELSVSELPAADENTVGEFLHGIFAHLVVTQIEREKSELMVQLRRIPPQDQEQFHQVQRQLLELETRKRGMQTRR